MTNSIFHMDRKTYINLTSPKTDMEFQLETHDFDFGQCLLLSIENGFSIEWDEGCVTIEMIYDVWNMLEQYYDLPNIYKIHKQNTEEDFKDYGEDFIEKNISYNEWEYIPFAVFKNILKNFIELKKTPTKEYTINQYKKEVKKI